MRECETKIFIWGCGLNPSLYGKYIHLGSGVRFRIHPAHTHTHTQITHTHTHTHTPMPI